MMYTNSKARLARATTRSGFTLIEIMVVVLIVGLLGALIGPNIMRRFTKAKASTAKSQLKMLQGAIGMFELDFGKPPERLNELVRKPAPSQYYDADELNEWQQGGYLGKDAKKLPVDPWKKKFQYRLTPGAEHPYELSSFGGKMGKAEPRNKRISVWDD